MFPLCRKCGETENDHCNHLDNERYLVDTWCTPEINKALEYGYKIIKIYEVWNFEERSSTLFKEYMSKWIKVKMENSKVPDDIDSLEKEVFEKYGFHLGPIKHNPGVRQISKMLAV